MVILKDQIIIKMKYKLRNKIKIKKIENQECRKW
jgi:hypothetical protein